VGFPRRPELSRSSSQVKVLCRALTASDGNRDLTGCAKEPCETKRAAFERIRPSIRTVSKRLIKLQQDGASA
jgi:hypothetical protein